MKHLTLGLPLIAVLLTLALTLATPRAHAMVSPLAVSIVPPVQFPPEDFTITGARVNVIYGNHFKVYGFDVGGIGNMTSQTMGGIQVAGGFNYNKGETQAVGIQAAGIGNWNINKANVIGVQAAGLVNANYAESFVLGAVLSAVNLTEHTRIVFLEAGLYNVAREVYGFQIGVINKVDTLHGLQIGLLNYNAKGIFAVAPFLNFGF